MKHKTGICFFKTLYLQTSTWLTWSRTLVLNLSTTMTLTFYTRVHVHTHFRFWQISVLLHLCKTLFIRGENPTLGKIPLGLFTTSGLSKSEENVHTRQKSKSEMHEEKVFFHINSHQYKEAPGEGGKNNYSLSLLLLDQNLQWPGKLVVLITY